MYLQDDDDLLLESPKPEKYTNDLFEYWPLNIMTSLFQL
jgi:hypothetical protein